MLTTAFSNYAYGKISITGIIALGLLGQAMASLVIDWLGLFGMTAYPPKSTRCWTDPCVSWHCCHAEPFVLRNSIPCFYLSSKRDYHRSLPHGQCWFVKTYRSLKGSFINHLAGLPVTMILLFLFGRNEAVFQNFTLSPHVGSTLEEP